MVRKSDEDGTQADLFFVLAASVTLVKLFEPDFIAQLWLSFQISHKTSACVHVYLNKGAAIASALYMLACSCDLLLSTG